MKDLVISENLITSTEVVDGRMVIKFTEDTKRCKACLNYKHTDEFSCTSKEEDGYRENCIVCIKEYNFNRKKIKLRKEVLNVIDKIRPGVMADTMLKIRKVANNHDNIDILRKLKIDAEKIYFKQCVNDEMLNNIINR